MVKLSTNTERLLKALEAQHGGTWAGTDGLTAVEGREVAKELRTLAKDYAKLEALLRLVHANGVVQNDTLLYNLMRAYLE